jgi:hypothetical protein
MITCEDMIPDLQQSSANILENPTCEVGNCMLWKDFGPAPLLDAALSSWNLSWHEASDEPFACTKEILKHQYPAARGIHLAMPVMCMQFMTAASSIGAHAPCINASVCMQYSEAHLSVSFYLLSTLTCIYSVSSPPCSRYMLWFRLGK